jgi:hypothetical protein
MDKFKGSNEVKKHLLYVLTTCPLVPTLIDVSPMFLMPPPSRNALYGGKVEALLI